MTKASLSLSKTYVSALLGHLSRPDEVGLNQAYEIGRAALSGGFGVLDMAMLHHEALGSLTSGATTEVSRSQLAKAAEFFAEALSPFEMSLRGYQETNARLAATNKILERAKAETEAVNRELEAFSYSVAHDLRTPIHVIDGYAQALLKDYAAKLDEGGKGYLEAIGRYSQRMGQLIEDLLSLSRVAKVNLHRTDIDLSLLAHAIIKTLQASQPERQVEVVIRDGIHANGDARLLPVLLENLLGNAWKYTSKREDSRIEFSMTARKDGAVYHVRDNGAGFDMAKAGRLFAAFERLHSPEEFEGSGIGLATVERIVSRHGGRVWAESSIGQGATFHFTLGDES
ncbi:MAG TPA: ATP-binding protein [Dongiaceae bacterium]|nr:ATP-binding protein [Dongiaceae bacterium]